VRYSTAWYNTFVVCAYITNWAMQVCLHVIRFNMLQVESDELQFLLSYYSCTHVHSRPLERGKGISVAA